MTDFDKTVTFHSAGDGDRRVEMYLPTSGGGYELARFNMSEIRRLCAREDDAAKIILQDGTIVPVKMTLQALDEMLYPQNGYAPRLISLKEVTGTAAIPPDEALLMTEFNTAAKKGETYILINGFSHGQQDKPFRCAIPKSHVSVKAESSEHRGYAFFKIPNHTVNGKEYVYIAKPMSLDQLTELFNRNANGRIVLDLLVETLPDSAAPGQKYPLAEYK